MKQYKFTSRSALSFAVTHNGRQMYVSFSPAYRGLSYYITTDESLAQKIRAHRWYRDGRINEQVVEIKQAAEEKPYQPVMPPQPKKYSILGKPMSTAAPQQAHASRPAAQPEAAQEAPAEAPAAYSAEEVTTFMEAKEFFINNYGMQRSDVASKDALAALCKELGVVFPNYPL